jgi:hypothetical protein
VKQEFEEIVSTAFQWLLLLHTNSLSFTKDFGCVLFDYLNSLNKESIYYNMMMFNVLKKEVSCGSCYLDELFKLRSNPLMAKFCELCFTMFSLDEFKVWLCDRVFSAYNTVPDF